MEKKDYEHMAGIEIAVDTKTLGQALFIRAVVLPEIAAVVDRYTNDIIELGQER